MSETRLRIVPEDEPPQGQTLREATDETDRAWLDALWDILEGGIPSRLEAQTTMPPKTVHETCSCGATFAYEGEQPLAAAADFRRNHRHAESVGICGDMAPPPLVGDTEMADRRDRGEGGR